jgi:lipoyl(octanoyl) transferase
MQQHRTSDRVNRAGGGKGAHVEWAVSRRPVGYGEALKVMESRVDQIVRGEAAELVWLLEHPPLYTAGTSARPDELLEPGRFPVYPTGRGGRFTYHGPGQRVVYVMLDVKQRGGDVRGFVAALEDWIIASLARLGVGGERREGRVGIWVRRPDKGPGAEDKIAAIGLRLRKWVSLHGLSLNVSPDLSHYAGIVPCGIAEHGVTSLADLGGPASMQVVDNVLQVEFERRFGPVAAAPDPLAAAEPGLAAPGNAEPGPLVWGPGSQTR